VNADFWVLCWDSVGVGWLVEFHSVLVALMVFCIGRTTDNYISTDIMFTVHEVLGCYNVIIWNQGVREVSRAKDKRKYLD